MTIDPLTLDEPKLTTRAQEFDILNPPSEMVATFGQKMLWYSRLAKARRDADDRVDQIKARMAELDPHLIEEMALNGVDRQTVEGMTIYPQTDFYVNKKAEKDGVTTTDVCQALRQAGWGDLVSDGYSASSLKARVKELKSEGLEIHPVLVPVLNIGEQVKLVTRKA